VRKKRGVKDGLNCSECQTMGHQKKKERVHNRLSFLIDRTAFLCYSVLNCFSGRKIRKWRCIMGEANCKFIITDFRVRLRREVPLNAISNMAREMGTIPEIDGAAFNHRHRNLITLSVEADRGYEFWASLMPTIQSIVNTCWR